MTPEYNMPPIKTGDNWSISFTFWEDECETTPIVIMDYIFQLLAVDSNGTSTINWDNTFFDYDSDYQRSIRLSSEYTNGMTPGEYTYELQATTPEGVFTYMKGFLKVEGQIVIPTP